MNIKHQPKSGGMWEDYLKNSSNKRKISGFLWEPLRICEFILWKPDRMVPNSLIFFNTDVSFQSIGNFFLGLQSKRHQCACTSRTKIGPLGLVKRHRWVYHGAYTRMAILMRKITVYPLVV